MTSSPPITAHLGAGEVDPGGLLQRVLGVGVLEEVQQVLQQAVHGAGAEEVSTKFRDNFHKIWRRCLQSPY